MSALEPTDPAVGKDSTDAAASASAPERDVNDERIGKVVQDRYRILSRIASGGMGVVYKAERVTLHRPVAIKFLHAQAALEAEFLRRFEVEAHAMSRLDHPHCVSVTDFGVDDVPYLVMDYVTGQTLGELIAEGPVPVRRTIHIMRQILAGLSHAHGQGIIHRDLKPDNIVLSQAAGFGDHVRILDFGLAKLRDHRGTRSTAETPIPTLAAGTPKYMAPEQIRAERVDACCDVYGAGILLFELLSGRRPFESPDLLEVLRMQQETPPPRLRDVAPAGRFSAELEAVIVKALAKSPRDRFQSAEALAQALDQTPEAKATSSQRSYKIVGLGVAGAALLGVVALIVVLRGQPEPAAAAGRSAAGGAPASANLGDAGTTLRQPERASTRGSAAADAGSAKEAAQEGISASIASRTLDDKEAARAAEKAIPELAEVHLGVRAGKREDAITRLVSLRRQHATSAYLDYLAGNLYFEKSWFSDGLAAYKSAIVLDGRYREHPVVIRNVIDGLGSHRFHLRASSFLVREIGLPARPFLRVAAVDHEDADVRARAARLLGKLKK